MKHPIFSLLGLGLASLCVSSALAAPQPDFQLPEVNPNAPRAGDDISPGDYHQQISVFYFSHEN